MRRVLFLTYIREYQIVDQRFRVTFEVYARARGVVHVTFEHRRKRLIRPNITGAKRRAAESLKWLVKHKDAYAAGRVLKRVEKGLVRGPRVGGLIKFNLKNFHKL